MIDCNVLVDVEKHLIYQDIELSSHNYNINLLAWTRYNIVQHYSYVK